MTTRTDTTLRPADSASGSITVSPINWRSALWVRTLIPGQAWSRPAISMWIAVEADSTRPGTVMVYTLTEPSTEPTRSTVPAVPRWEEPLPAGPGAQVTAPF